MTTMSNPTKFHGLVNLKEANRQELEAALQELKSGIEKLDQESIAGMQKRLDAKIKPLRSLGSWRILPNN